MADVKRVAKRLLDGGMLVTVVGRPQVTAGQGRLTRDPASTVRARYGRLASIDRCPRGAHRPRRRSAAAPMPMPWRAARDALAWIRARHADGKLPLLRLPEKTGDLAGINDAARAAGGRRERHRVSRHRRIEPRRPDVGAARRSRGAGARLLARRPAPALHGQSRSRHLCGGAGAPAARRYALRGDIEIRRHRRDPDADRRGAVGGAARPASPQRRPSCSSASPSPRSRAAATACATFSRGHGVAMLDHDPGVGGRFSVLTNVGLLPAAVAGLDIAALRRGAAAALAPILAGQAPARSRPRSARRSTSRSPPPGRSRSRC